MNGLDVWKEIVDIDLVETLQLLFSEVNEMNIVRTKAFLLNERFGVESMILVVARNIIHFVRIHPKSIDLLTDICSSFHTYLKTLEKSNIFRASLLDLCFTIRNSVEVSREVVWPCFVRKLMNVKLLLPQEAVDRIYTFRRNNLESLSLSCLFWMWFAPEIHYFHTDFYDECSFRFQKSRLRFSLPVGFAEVLQNWSEMEKDNFSHFYQVMKDQTSCPLLSFLMKDDLDGFRSFYVAHPCNFLDPDPFTGIEFVQCQPPVIHISAFIGSVNCFKYLLLNGADTGATDQLDRSLLEYAIVGGNTEIIRILEAAGTNLRRGLAAACLFHRQDILQWLMQSTAIDQCPEVLHAAAEGNNIFAVKMCLKMGISPGVLDAFGNNALHYCAKNDSLEAAIVLLSKSTDLSNCSGNGYPIHVAASANSVNVGKILLQCENQELIDSTETATGVFCEFILLRFIAQRSMVISNFSSYFVIME
jgi:hypothetical protein